MIDYAMYFAILILLIQVGRLGLIISKIKEDTKRMRELINRLYWDSQYEK